MLQNARTKYIQNLLARLAIVALDGCIIWVSEAVRVGAVRPSACVKIWRTHNCVTTPTSTPWMRLVKENYQSKDTAIAQAPQNPHISSQEGTCKNPGYRKKKTIFENKHDQILAPNFKESTISLLSTKNFPKQQRISRSLRFGMADYAILWATLYNRIYDVYPVMIYTCNSAQHASVEHDFF